MEAYPRETFLVSKNVSFYSTSIRKSMNILLYKGTCLNSNGDELRTKTSKIDYVLVGSLRKSQPFKFPNFIFICAQRNGSGLEPVFLLPDNLSEG